MIEVCTGKRRISKRNMFAHVSQCVAVGSLNELLIGGVAHIHYNTNHDKILSEMFEEMVQDSKLLGGIYVVGGANSFVPQFGPIFGERTAERVMAYLDVQFPHTEIHSYITGDMNISRDLFVHPSKKEMNVKDYDR